VQIELKLNKKINDSYKIIIDSNINIVNKIKNSKIGNKYMILTDNTVKKLYAGKLLIALRNSSIQAELISFKPGEKSKNLRTLDEILTQMLKLQYDRKSAIIAFGGGVTGDMAGLAAGLYMRGIPFIQIPTTLLAQVDSSIGGKTAVDLKYGKNTCGLFYQPESVIIDINFLKTLPQNEMKAGLIEMIKHGIIKSEKHFNYIEKHINSLLNYDLKKIQTSVHDSCLIKKTIVEKDEKENSIRMLLNCGHTIGHAFEAYKNYSITHGEGVATGLVLESFIAKETGLLNNNDYLRIQQLISKLHIFDINKIKIKKMLQYMKYDKKKIGATINLALPVRIGKAVIYSKLSISDIQAILAEYKA
jgi:3-dehydroquinate synthase